MKIRPLNRNDLSTLEAWQNDPHFNAPYNIFGFIPSESLTDGFNQNKLLTPNWGMLSITANGEEKMVGYVIYRPTMYGPNETSRSFNLGMMLEPSMRAQGNGTQALKTFVEYLFLTYPVIRLEAHTETVNIAGQKVLEKSKFKREGCIRKALWRNGEYRDLYVYSILRKEADLSKTLGHI